MTWEELWNSVLVGVLSNIITILILYPFFRYIIRKTFPLFFANPSEYIQAVYEAIS